MKKAAAVFAVMFCATALISASVFADGSCMGKCDMMSKHGKMWSEKGSDGMSLHKARVIMMKASELGLSDAQAQKIKDLEYSVKKSAIKDDADIASLALDIKQGLMKDDIDVNVVGGLIDQKYKIKAKKAKEDVEALANLKMILTPDQTKKLKDMCKGCAMKSEKMKEGRMMGAGMGKGE